MLIVQSFQRLILVISVAPLGVFGVVASLMLTGSPLGFVAILGPIALAGIITCKSVILVDPIERNRADGLHSWTAVVEAAMHRMRPILLTAAVAILCMVLIIRDVFWGPTAYNMVGATVLTLPYLTILYVAWLRIMQPEAETLNALPPEGRVLVSWMYLSWLRKSCLHVAAVPLSAALVVGCTQHPKGMLVPVPQGVHGVSQVGIVVATNRGRAESAGEMFSGERDPNLSFAKFMVSIPPESVRKVGEVQWPRHLPGNPATDFVTLKVDEISKAEAFRQVNPATSMTHGGHVLVFIHGFNNRFEDAVYRFAQIIHDSNAQVTPVLFSWPSRGSMFAYGYDRGSTNYSRDALEGVLQALARDRKINEISILAHSMGNWLALEALRQMSIRDGRIAVKIKTVMLAAPDVDVDVFRTQIAGMGRPRPNFTLFVSSDDKALALSRRVWGDTVRLGAINPAQEPYRSMLAENAIAVFDLSQIRDGDRMHHEKFAESPKVVQLIGRRLAGGQTLNDSRVGIGDRIVQLTTDAATAAGTAAGTVIAAPVAIIDTRDDYHNQLQRLGTTLGGSATPTRDLLIHTPADVAR